MDCKKKKKNGSLAIESALKKLTYQLLFTKKKKKKFKELKFFPSKLSCTAKPRDITLVTFPHHLPSIKEFRK